MTTDTKPAHTPGTWAVCDEDLSVRAIHPHEGPSDAPRVLSSLVADTANGAMRSRDEQRANARLIAAAPDLLAALIDLVGLANKAMWVANMSGGEYDRDAELSQASDAIAKATRTD